MNVDTSSDLQVTFSEPVVANATSFTIACAVTGAHNVTVTGGPTVFDLRLTTPLGSDELCDVTVVAANVTDVDTNDPPNAMAGNFPFSFRTETVPTMTIADNSIVEGNGGTSVLNFVVTTTGTATQDITFLASTQDITASEVDDYDGITNVPFTIPAASVPGAINIPITINGDTAVEGDETFQVFLTQVTNAQITDLNANGTITNDDVAATPTVTITSPSIIEGNAGPSQLVFDVAVQPTSGTDITFSVNTVDGIATDADNDYEPIAAGTGTIAANAPSTTVSVPINGDTTFEPNETFVVRLGNISANAVFPGGAATLDGTGTITNDDAAPINVSINDPSVTEGDSGTSTLAFVVTLSAPAPSGGVSFDIATAPGTATTGTDYVAQTLTTQTIAQGETLYAFNVTVNGDIESEAAETVLGNVSNVSGHSGGTVDTQGTGTINDNDVAAAIAEIQGDGIASPLNGATRTTTGVVTAVVSNGFIMQSETPDADVDTSEGLFVFTGGAPQVTGGGALAAGDRITIKGRIIEFGTAGTNTVTEITNSSPTPVIVRSAQGVALPTAVALDAVVPSPDLDAGVPCNVTGATGSQRYQANFECFEHMRVSVADGVVSAPNQTFGSDPQAEMWMAASGPRPARETGIRFDIYSEPGLPAGLPRWDGNPQIFELDADRLSATIPNVIVPGSRFSVPSGILSAEFGDYELWPDTLTVTAAAAALPRPVLAATATQVAIGSINVENFFDTIQIASDGTDDDITPAEFADKMDEFVAYVCDVMRAPHVVGLVEVENMTVLDAMAAALNARANCLPSGVTYRSRFGAAGNGLVDGNDPRYIDVAFIARSDVNVTAITQLDDAQTTTQCSGTPPCVLHDRPPLLLEGTSTAAGEPPVDFAVMVNHLRSLNGIDDQSDLTDANRIRRKRLDQAVNVAQEVVTFQAANPGVPLVLIGDYNAFEFTDGYADVMGAITGTANTATDALPRDSQYEIQDLYPAIVGNVVSPPMTNLSALVNAQDRYSYLFDGYVQVLDHALVNAAALSRTSGFGYTRGNADAPEAFDADPGPAVARDFRLTDHDGFVVLLEVGGTPDISDLANQFTSEDVATAPIPFTVTDVETDPADLVVTASSSNQGVVAASGIALGGSGSDRTIQLTPVANASGTTTITLTVTDGDGNTASDTFVLTVSPVNDGPTISAVADRTIDEDTTTGAIPFTISDADHPLTCNDVQFSSSNDLVAPEANIVIGGGTGTSCTVTVTPLPNATGSTVIELSISDGAGGFAAEAFTLTVDSGAGGNDAPTITGPGNQTLALNGTTGPLPVTIGDVVEHELRAERERRARWQRREPHRHRHPRSRSLGYDDDHAVGHRR
ncbi:MAG TPA: Calx-beta domain-containing protein [Candidatus Saccharimonadia bacterium]|nr:Calx-beta domain-containing protein [Candidatus Saccharimonadia bacterium]